MQIDLAVEVFLVWCNMFDMSQWLPTAVVGDRIKMELFTLRASNGKNYIEMNKYYWKYDQSNHSVKTETSINIV